MGSSSWIHILISITLVCIHTCMGRIGFVKDQSVDVEFPPRPDKPRPDSVIPVGHLRPLGHQRRSDGKIKSADMLTPQDFYDKYVSQSIPIVLKDAMKEVPAMLFWAKDDYLKRHYGELDIHVVVKKELLRKGPQKLKMKKFLKEYNYEDWYLSNIAPQEMLHELLLPKCLKCGYTRYLHESEVWMSSGGTSSLLHSHADHDLHCLLSGRKDFILIEQRHRDSLNFVHHTHPESGHSTLDVDMVNMFDDPVVGKVPWKWATLKPGDCIYIPAGLLHQVRSHGRSISSTIHWTPVPDGDLDFTDCKDLDLEEEVALDDVSFIWMYTDGDRKLSNAKLSPPSLRHHLLLLIRANDTLSFDLFADFYREVLSDVKDSLPVENVWDMVANGKKTISRNDILEMDSNTLFAMASILNNDAKPSVKRDEL